MKKEKEFDWTFYDKGYNKGYSDAEKDLKEKLAAWIVEKLL